MNSTLSILFYIKRAKVNKDGLCPIYVRVTVNSKRFEFSSNKFVAPEKWPSHLQHDLLHINTLDIYFL